MNTHEPIENGEPSGLVGVRTPRVGLALDVPVEGHGVAIVDTVKDTVTRCSLGRDDEAETGIRE